MEPDRRVIGVLIVFVNLYILFFCEVLSLYEVLFKMQFYNTASRINNIEEIVNKNP